MLRKLLFTICIIFLLFIGYRTFIKNNDVTIYGVINQADSIGRQPLDLINMLSGEVDMNFIGKIISTRDLNANAKSVLRNFNFKIGHIFFYEYVFNVWGEEDYKFNRTKYKLLSKINGLDKSEQIWIAYSMFESDKISSFWVEELNKNYDLVVLPDSNLVPIYEKSGVKIPIFVAPLAVNYGDAITQPLKSEAHPIFTFADFSAMIDRKNTVKLLQAFKQAFGNRKDVRLLLSSRMSEDLHRQKIIDYIVNNQMNNVDYDISIKNTDTYNKLFDQVDCYISLSKGEGFSVQPREAMARGIPVIVSTALAQKTIADSGFTKAVNANIEKPAFYYDGQAMIGQNFDVDVNEAANAMLDVYNNYQEYLKYSAEARKWAEQYTYDNIRALYLNLVKPKKIFLGKENKVTKDYLETNSKELYHKYNNMFLKK
ncbi:MAG: glycosyltransferase [Rickettsiales bacterium]|jgi:glycosyltransferase involved in cell wall biosynthesis|nr:glycosyltransferase [Rickettsiales bacterium]